MKDTTKKKEAKKTCGAILKLGDDYGDNETTVICQRTLGHKGRHMETAQPFPGQKVRITWPIDERSTRKPDNL